MSDHTDNTSKNTNNKQSGRFEIIEKCSFIKVEWSIIRFKVSLSYLYKQSVIWYIQILKLSLNYLNKQSVLSKLNSQ